MDDDIKAALAFGVFLVLALLLFVYAGGFLGDTSPDDTTPTTTVETTQTTSGPSTTTLTGTPSETTTTETNTTTTDTQNATCPEA